MKLKCKDGVTRHFTVCVPHWRGIGLEEAVCQHCGYKFGFHDTDILKPMFKEHVCVLHCGNCRWKGSNFSYNKFGEPRCPKCDSGQPLLKEEEE
jgi:hypothetical protein